MHIKPCTEIDDEFNSIDLPIGTVETDEFPDGGRQEPWAKFACVDCRSDRLQVARRGYTTMARCPACGWTHTIHEG